ncbi:hypothetical protein KC19_VG181500 [Ceratodon purpureus]|uniref:At4g15545-like C-terminal domain-containing protein n=1 Tax=Ceratodon purpureus TaxID=3225 RepID=A0A8T0HR96_CERPU|nr:hypothetical protein KC19_VG181500 [Ceratodon purpureus]
MFAFTVGTKHQLTNHLLLTQICVHTYFNFDKKSSHLPLQAREGPIRDVTHAPDLLGLFLRNRLQYEQFSAFLANIKELNVYRQTREVFIQILRSS